MDREILDFTEESDESQNNRFLKIVGAARFILSAQIIFSVLSSTYYYITLDLSEESNIDVSDRYYFFGFGLIYILFVYYQITQGVNEINFNKLITQNRGLKIYSLLIISILLFKYLKFLPRIELLSFYGMIQLFLTIIIVIIWRQDIKYVFKRKKSEENLT